jgi:hypothetical protein
LQHIQRLPQPLPVKMMSKKILHILCVEPDDTVQQFIESISGETGVNVVCLYDDGIAKTAVNWERLVEDIFAHEKVICWN